MTATQQLDSGDPSPQRLSQRNGLKPEDQTQNQGQKKVLTPSIIPPDTTANEINPPKIDQVVILDVDPSGRDGVGLIDVFAIYVSRGKDGKADTSIFEQTETETPKRRVEPDIWTQPLSPNLAGGRLWGARTGRLTKELTNQLKADAVTSEPSLREDGYISPNEKSKGFNWLADEGVLPSFLPVARIVGFNIDLKSNMHAPLDFDRIATEITSRITTIRAKDQRRAVVFVSHGYGAIVLKRLLSGEVQESASFKGSTAVVLFFGAPFLSLDPLLNWTAQSLSLSKKENLFGSKSAKDLVSPSQSWSKFLRDLKQQDISSYAFLEQSFSAANEGTSEKERVYGGRELKLDLDWPMLKQVQA